MNALEYAIQMERDGEEYYAAQAELNKNNSLHQVCRILSDDEKNHGEILRQRLAEKPYVLKDSVIMATVKNVFADLDNFKSEIKAIPSQLDFYRMAADKEKESIDLYKGFLAAAVSEADKELFRYLIQQEINHFTTLEELTTLLEHAEEWVEAAEFGLRQDY